MAIDPQEFYPPTLVAEQYTGMIKTREPGLYSARLRIPVGIVTSPILAGVAQLADTYGRGEVYLTARLGMEIPGVSEANFPALRDALAALGVGLAGCGPRMRSTVACKGTVCPHGNVDTFALGWEIDRRYNDAAVLPHKFKVAIAGCASSCSKPQVNDVGLVGVSEPEVDPGACVGCGICVEACHLDAVRLEAGLPVFDKKRCVRCGDCTKACPAAALNAARVGLDLYAGGRWGREKQVGVRLAQFLSPEEAVQVVGRIKHWYAANGRKKERLGKALLRLGIRPFQEAVLVGIPSDKWVVVDDPAEAAFRVLR